MQSDRNVFVLSKWISDSTTGVSTKWHLASGACRTAVIYGLSDSFCRLFNVTPVWLIFCIFWITETNLCFTAKLNLYFGAIFFCSESTLLEGRLHPNLAGVLSKEFKTAFQEAHSFCVLTYSLYYFHLQTIKYNGFSRWETLTGFRVNKKLIEHLSNTASL